MSTLSFAANNFFGLVELDATGTVLYSRLDREAWPDAPPDIRGSNYYTEVAPFANVEEFRARMGRFEQDGSPAESFTFDCLFAGDLVVPVRVLLARMRQRGDGGPPETVLMHIKKI